MDSIVKSSNNWGYNFHSFDQSSSSGTPINLLSPHAKPCVSWLRKTFCLKIFLLRLARISVHYCSEEFFRRKVLPKTAIIVLFSLFSVVKLQ